MKFSMGLRRIPCQIRFSWQFHEVFYMKSHVVSMENFTCFLHGIPWGIKPGALFCILVSSNCYLFSDQCEMAGCPCVPEEAGRPSTYINRRRRTLLAIHTKSIHNNNTQVYNHNSVQYSSWLVAWHGGRTSVCDRRTFPVLYGARSERQ